MSVYRRKLQNGKRSKKYTAEFIHRNRLHRLGGFVTRAIAEDWIRSEQVRLQRGELALPRAQSSTEVAPLITEYVDSLEELGRDSMYVYTTGQRLKRLAKDCGWATLGDVDAESFRRWMRSKPAWRGKKLGARTLNQYVDTVGQFGAWLVKPRGVLPVNPLADLERKSAAPNAFYRRSATLEEVQKLLAKAPPDRQRFYQFLLYSPIRMKAVRALVWDDLRLDGPTPCVQVRAEIDKARKGQQLPMRADVAAMMRKVRGKSAGSDPVFPEPPTIADLKADLEAAGVPFSDEKGNRRLDFHAFRRTLIRFLKASGVSMDVAHQALGHADKRTTERWYDDALEAAPIASALESLPGVAGTAIGGQK